MVFFGTLHYLKTAYIALSAAGIFLIAFAACHSWPGDAAEVLPPKIQIESGDTIAFVTGAEAEPPALPDGLPMPEPRKAKSASVSKSKSKAKIPAAPLGVNYVTPEMTKKNHLAIHAVSISSTGVVQPASKPLFTPRAAPQWND